jgi:hypothetical protein
MLYRDDPAAVDTNTLALASVPRMPDGQQFFSQIPSALFPRNLAVAIFPSAQQADDAALAD